MGKGHRFRLKLPRRAFLVAAGGTFVIMTGIASAVLTISGRHFELAGSGATLLAALVVSGLLNYRLLISPQVAVDDVLGPDLYEDPCTRVVCPCDIALANQAKALAERCFSGSVTIGPDTFEQFRVKNPLILACLTSRSGSLLGYFDAIPLSATFAEALLRGTATEAQITHEDVLSRDEAPSCRHLFISGFAVAEPESHAGRRNASMLTWALLDYLDVHYASVKPLVFALAATPSGDQILKRFKLDLRSTGGDRRDGYRLYSVPLSREEISRRLACIPDWRGICRPDWSQEVVNDPGRRPVPPQSRPWDLGPGTVPV